MARITELRKKIIETFGRAFPGCVVKIDPVSSSGKLSGLVTWEGFSGKDQVDRQMLIRDQIREYLTDEERLKISVFFTLTPHELEIIHEEAG